jgi:nucleoid DNA-binding protein
MSAPVAKKAMPKGEIADSLACTCGQEKSDVVQFLNDLATIGGKEVKGTGKFTIPGICMIKTKHKAATKAGTRLMFGEEMKVKAKPARTFLKAFAVSALKKSV